MRLLFGWAGVAMLLCGWSWVLFRLWELLGRVCSIGGMEDEQLGGLDIDLDKHGRNVEGPVATYGSVTGRTWNNAGRGNCFWYAVSQLRFGHARSWRRIKKQVLMEANQEPRRSTKQVVNGLMWAVCATSITLVQETKPLVLRLWSNHFEAVRVNSARFHGRPTRDPLSNCVPLALGWRICMMVVAQISAEEAKATKKGGATHSLQIFLGLHMI